MWISIKRDALARVLRSTHCGILTYLFDDTMLIDCKYLQGVTYPIPEDLTATAMGSASISLSWTNTSTAFGISIERRTVSTAFAQIAIGTAGETSYLDEGLTPETQYFYRIRYYSGFEIYEVSTEANATTQAEGIKYGALYNWYAVTDVRNICSAGWHVPSDTEYNILIAYLGGQINSAKKVKEEGIYWISNPDFIGTNEAKFNFRGSGGRFSLGGAFASLRERGMLYTSTAAVPVPGYVYMAEINIFFEDFSLLQISFATGLGIRPLKDYTTLTHGQTGTYTGNDGKVYRTICIGTQEWLADNLCETQYRDGTAIPEVTDDTAWAALETGAWCAYNNDHDNI